MLPAKIKNKIISTYAQQSSQNINTELEARFGLFDKTGFKAGVNRSIFNRVKAYFDSRAASSNTKTTDYIMGQVRFSLEDDEDGTASKATWIIKKRLWNEQLPDYGIRYSMSQEIPIDPIPEQNFLPELIRVKERSSYLVFGNTVRIDITLVHTMKNGQKKIHELNNEDVTYEVEIELMDRSKLDNFEKAINVTLALVMDTIILYTEKERLEVTNYINSILGSNKRGLLDYYPLVQARNLKLKDMVYGGLIGNEKTGYSATHKADGVRRLLVFSNSGVWLVSPPSTLTRISDKKFRI